MASDAEPTEAAPRAETDSTAEPPSVEITSSGDERSDDESAPHDDPAREGVA